MEVVSISRFAGFFIWPFHVAREMFGELLRSNVYIPAALQSKYFKITKE